MNEILKIGNISLTPDKYVTVNTKYNYEIPLDYYPESLGSNWLDAWLTQLSFKNWFTEQDKIDFIDVYNLYKKRNKKNNCSQELKAIREQNGLRNKIYEKTINELSKI